MKHQARAKINAMNIAELIAQWDSGEGKPFKGKLIDAKAYAANPSPSCMCAQGQALHYIGGRSIEWLKSVEQVEADAETAKLLGISRAHAVLLRSVNDSVDGAPSIVLTDPAKVLGDQAHIVLAFWHHLDTMTADQWAAERAAAWAAARAAARDAAWDAAGDAARAAAGDAAGDAAWDAAWDAAGAAAWAAERAAARDAAWAAARAAERAAAWAASWAAARASNEIQGAAVMRAKGQAFYFLPLFGFANPEAIEVPA